MEGVRCMLMRGGTSKGAYFVADELPADPTERDQLLLRIMGSPDPRQIDGLGGSHPLTSKVAVVAAASDDSADVEYLFLQVGVDTPTVSDQQNCGNLLSGVAQFALERGLVKPPPDGEAAVRIRLLNHGERAVVRFPVADGMPVYRGDRSISGVPGTAAEVRIEFQDTVGSTCGALLPTGRVADTIAGTEVTCIDNGMPVVVLRAADVGAEGDETPATLEADPAVRAKIEAIRLAAGPLIGLGDVTGATVPKMTLVSAPRQGGTLTTRTFIPHRVHDAIGVLGAVSVATAVQLAGSVAHAVAGRPEGGVTIEHPTGYFDVVMDVAPGAVVRSAGVVRTARKLHDGVAFARDYEP